MTPAEATSLVAAITVATGVRPAEASPDAWAYLLDDVPIGAALEAVKAIAHRPQPHERRLTIDPAMIRDQIRRDRNKRIDAMEAYFIPSSGDPAVYLAELRAHRQAAAAGTLKPPPRRAIAERRTETIRIGNAIAQIGGGL
nr:MAG TPA: hypothetical protein [Caudoviricetes sp.]